jgi:hypothetical protein
MSNYDGDITYLVVPRSLDSLTMTGDYLLDMSILTHHDGFFVLHIIFMI